MIQLRPFDRTEDYPLAEAWWQGHSWSAVPLNILPALGMVAMDGHAPVAMAWLYLDNSTGVGMLEWIVTDPQASARVSALGIAHLVRCLREAAKNIGYGVLLASCRQESLARLMERCGFARTDSDVIHLLSINPLTPEPE